MERVAIVGPGGAGKSRLADELGRRTGLPVIHLDRHFWRPGWVALPSDEWAALQRQLVAGARWIADGNYGNTIDIRFERADTVVVLSLPRWRCVARVLRRSIANYGRDVQADGCPERITWEFLSWVWHYPSRSRSRIDDALARHADRLTVIELGSGRQVKAFLAGISHT